MSRQDNTNSKKILGLSVGVVAAVGFAGWNLTKSLSPAPAKPDTPASASPAPEAPSAAAAQAESTSGVTIATAKPAESELLLQESLLAPQADPFLAIAAAAPAQPVMPVATTGGTRTRGPAFIPGPGPGPLPPTTGYQPVPEKQAPPVEPAPELVGTLMGDRPSAVFRGEGRVILVSVGKSINGWTVLSVTHGSVTVRGHGKRLELDVLSGASTGVIRAAEKSEAPVAVAKNPFDMVPSAPMAVVPRPAPMPLPAAPAAPAPRPASMPQPAATAPKPLPGLEPIFVGTKPAPQPAPSPGTAPADDKPVAPVEDPILELAPLPAPAPGPATAPSEPAAPGKGE